MIKDEVCQRCRWCLKHCNCEECWLFIPGDCRLCNEKKSKKRNKK